MQKSDLTDILKVEMTEDGRELLKEAVEDDFSDTVYTGNNAKEL